MMDERNAVPHEKEKEREQEATPDRTAQIRYALGAVEADLAQAESARSSIRDIAGKMGAATQRTIDHLEKRAGTDPTANAAYRKALLDRRLCQLVGNKDNTETEEPWDED